MVLCSATDPTLTLRGATNSSSISPKWHNLLVIDDIIQVSESTLKLPAVDRLRSLASVFEGDTEVSSS